MTAGMGDRNGSKRVVLIVASAVAGAGQLVVGFFTFTAVGLIGIPVWAIGVLAGLWVAAAALLVRVARTNPGGALAIPIANALLLWAIVAGGGAWLGWTS